MASSVSSESMGSASGVANKRRERAEEGIVEALQCLRSFINEDLFFHDVVDAAQEEVTLDLADQNVAKKEADSRDVVRDGEGWCWDELVESLDDDEEVCELICTVQ
jgi:hypothetical protein